VPAVWIGEFGKSAVGESLTVLIVKACRMRKANGDGILKINKNNVGITE
jgi:hypothetical protein